MTIFVTADDPRARETRTDPGALARLVGIRKRQPNIYRGASTTCPDVEHVRSLPSPRATG